MRVRRAKGMWLAAVLVVGACSTPDTISLQQSFVAQVEAIGIVRDFQRDGDELEFSAPDASGADVIWRVHIDSVAVEPSDDERYPYQGVVKSSWYANGELVEPDGVISFLPTEFLDQGIAQECWALWEEESGHWDW